MTIIERPLPADAVTPHYNMTQAEGVDVMREAVSDAAGNLALDGTNVLLTGPHTDLANFARSFEVKKLPTIPEVMAGYEDASRFVVVLQDATDGIASIPLMPAHIYRVHSLEADDATDKPTGLPTFDDVLQQGLATEEELLEFYKSTSLRELGTHYINVESNVAVEGAGLRKPYSALGYRAIFKLVQAWKNAVWSPIRTKVRSAHWHI